MRFVAFFADSSYNGREGENLILDPHLIGINIRGLRLSASESQEQLAAVANISARTVSGLENGKVTPSLTTIANIADHFDCTIDYIVFGENEK